MRTTKIIFVLLCAVLATHGSAISRELHKDSPTQKSFGEPSQFSFLFIPHKETNNIIGYKFNPKFEESAHLLGLQPGDTIMKINGVRVRNMEVMTRMFEKLVTEDLALEILRKGVVLEVTAEPSLFRFSFIPHKETNHIIGYKFNPESKESAHRLGLQPRDTIMKINGVRVTNMELMTRMFKKLATEDLELEILRKGVVLEVTVSLTPTPQLSECTEQLETTRESIRSGMGQDDLFRILGSPNTLSFQTSDAEPLFVAIYDAASFVFDSTLLIVEIVLHPEQCDA